MFAKKNMWLLAVLVACDEPYTKPENENADPIVEEVFMRDGVDGADGTTLSHAESVLFDLSIYREGAYVGPQVLQPSQYPLVRFNKLIDGDSLEATEEDILTKRKLGQCGLVAGDPLEFLENGKAIPSENILACYSPSDRMVSVRPSEDGGPVNFLKYDTEYSVHITGKILDKQKKAMQNTTINFTTAPFQLLTVTGLLNKDATPIWGAPGTLFEELSGANGDTDSMALRLLFSGPMAGEDAIASLKEVKVLVMGPSGPVELQSSDGKGATVTSLVSSLTPAVKPVSTDVRIVAVYPPAYVISKGKQGFAVGDYVLRIPDTVTDDGSVTGAPVKVRGALDIPFKITEPPPPMEEDDGR